MSYQKEEQDIVNFIKKLYQTVRKIGMKRFSEIIETAKIQDNFPEKESQLINFIIKCSAENYNINEQEIIKKHTKGASSDARKMCFVIINKHFDFTHKNIALYFGRNDHALVSKAIREFNSMNTKIKTHKDFIDKFNKINEIVEVEKEKIYFER
jgi:chromosomal replication initiation ATPase DnaA